MKKILATVFLGTLLALATASLVLVYWLMLVVFHALQWLTYPLHLGWRALRR